MHNEVPRILFVESDSLLSEVTAFRLELLGYEVVAVSSGEEAFELMEERLPDVAIIDLVLPGITGVELIERITLDQRTAEVAVMALSIEADLDAVQRAYNAGARDYLVAPYDPATLESKVETLLEQRPTGRI